MNPIFSPTPFTFLRQTIRMAFIFAVCLLVSTTLLGQSANARKSSLVQQPANKDVNVLIYEAAVRNGIDPRLYYYLVKKESSHKAGAVSPKGAKGLAQLMPGTAARFGVQNIFDPAENLEGGAKYLRFLLDLFDNQVPLALAGYNAGEGAVIKYGYRVPPYSETMDYVERICANYYGRSGISTLFAYKQKETPSVKFVQLTSFTSEKSKREKTDLIETKRGNKQTLKEASGRAKTVEPKKTSTYFF